MEANIYKILQDYYHLKVQKITSQQGGWAALAYKVITNKSNFFLKVYEKKRASTKELTDVIDYYMPLVLEIAENDVLTGRIPKPIMTSDNAYKCEDELALYMLYPYIDGETIGNQPLQPIEVTQYAEMIAELHQIKSMNINEKLKEKFEVSFAENLKQRLTQKQDQELTTFLYPYKVQLIELIDQLVHLGMELKQQQLPFSLVHTDLHHWNLMRENDRLIIIDWEGLQLAPAEADLMFVMDQSYKTKFLETYVENRPDYTIHNDVLSYYQLKRKLEDIWEFIVQLLEEPLTLKERRKVFDYIQEELYDVKEKTQDPEK
ncbi:aminoglycoside phosphotransferase family protein [Ornithinibacillus salinisoli]|uniref:Aminoglycoside phosphotransferase family protein n=1 Tax=Ornithinibacillus salinisoli TaxID=1848459 RepID=A0ABW4W1N8_9BACI